MSEDRRDATEPRRFSDILLKELIIEVRGFREDMKIMRGQIAPLNELSKQIYAAKMAAIWGFGIMAIIGSIIAWWVTVREGVKAAVSKM